MFHQKGVNQERRRYRCRYKECEAGGRKNPHTDGEEIPGLKVSKSTLKTEDEGPGRDITKKKINKLD